MALNKISAFPGSRQKTQRLGRGTSSGRGHTAGRGNKGQNARAGAKFRLGEQTTLLKQMPKRRGFTAVNPDTYSLVSLDLLQTLADSGTTDISPEVLVLAGLAKSKDTGVKILANGSITAKITLTAHKCSAAARQAIEKAGGSVTLLDA
ncbi:MAG TPA: 50S ribosomal protein L15 [bacterium]|nr:50S ribosomal protein L15 [bacterium]